MTEIAISPQFQEVFDIIGKRWTGLIIIALFPGPQHFMNLIRLIPNIPDSTLSSRLKELMQAGIVARRVERRMPICITYQLTEKGVALRPVMQQMKNWATTWGQ